MPVTYGADAGGTEATISSGATVLIQTGSGGGVKLPSSPASGDANTLDCYLEVAPVTCGFIDDALASYTANGVAYPNSGNAQINASTLVGSATIGFVRIGKMVYVRGSYTVTSVTYNAGGTNRVPVIDPTAAGLPVAAIGITVADLIQVPAMLTSAADTTGMVQHIVEFRPGMKLAAGGTGRIVIAMGQIGSSTVQRTFGWNGTVSLPIGTVKFQFTYEAA